MQFSILRESLLKPLMIAAGAVEKKLTLPILSHILVEVAEDYVTLYATDTEVEWQTRIPLINKGEPGQFTIPGRKLIDIVRNLPENCDLYFQESDHKIQITAARSRFSLSTLPVHEFPRLALGPYSMELTLEASDLLKIIEQTYFSMAQNDVRVYLNGLLLDLNKTAIIAVATDGHRLATSELKYVGQEVKQIIIPRKGVLEAMRLLGEVQGIIQMEIADNHWALVTDDYAFRSRLIEGRFPDYRRVIPKQGDIQVSIDRDQFKDHLTCVAVLSNEKYHGVRLQFRHNLLRLMANNPAFEEGESEIEVEYLGNDFDIGFNVSYLLDILNHLPAGKVSLSLKSSLLIQSENELQSVYVVMPMRL